MINVSFSGLTTSPDITPVRYPVETEIEGQMGVGFEHLHQTARVPLGNWWPGQAELSPNDVVEIHNNDYARYMDPEHKRFGELVGIARWTTETGITGTKKVYQWSFRDYDDLIIVENVFENTGDTDGDGAADLNGGAGLTLNDVYFAFYNYFWPTEGGTANRDKVDRARGYYYWLLRRSETENYNVDQDDVYRYSEAANYGSADPSYSDVPDAVGLKLSFAFNGDSPLTARDDTGDPHFPENQCCWGRQNFQIRGEIQAGQYVGLVPIDWDPTDGFANDTETYVAPKVMDQPFAVPWFTHKEEPDIARHSEDEIGHALVSIPLDGERPSLLNLDGRTPFPENPTSALPIQPNPSRVGETVEKPMSPNWYAFSHTYGPYDLMLGDKAKIVMAFVAAMPVEENMWEWQRNVPQNQQDLLAGKGAQNLVKHARKAKEIYEFGYDVPLPPPDVKMWIDNTPEATAKISWESIDDLEDPDYAGSAEARDIAGYRVYRSDFYVDAWQLLKDIPVGDGAHLDPATNTYSLIDDAALAGFEYYYAVTAYDTGHSDYKGRGSVPSLEAGLGAPEQIFRNSYIPVSPAVASNPTANRLEALVRVVPNPFLADGVHAYLGSEKIRFVNLPNKADVKIFSVAGDLVAAFKHDDPAVGEFGFTQATAELTGSLSAGIYYFVVRSEASESLGKIQRGTFVVVGGTVK